MEEMQKVNTCWRYRLQQYICEQIYLLFGNICQGTNICLTCLNTYSSRRRGASQNIKKLNVQEIGRFSVLRLLSRASCLMSIDGCISINPHTYLGKRMASKALALMRGTTSRCHLKTNEKQIQNNTKTQIWVTKSQQYYNGPIANAIHLYVMQCISIQTHLQIQNSTPGKTLTRILVGQALAVMSMDAVQLPAVWIKFYICASSEYTRWRAALCMYGGG